LIRPAKSRPRRLRRSSPAQLTPPKLLRAAASSFSGGPSRCTTPGAPHRSRHYCHLGVPVLGICTAPTMRCCWAARVRKGDLGRIRSRHAGVGTDADMHVPGPLARRGLYGHRDVSETRPRRLHTPGTPALRNCRDGRSGAKSLRVQYHRKWSIRDAARIYSPNFVIRRSAPACRWGPRNRVPFRARDSRVPWAIARCSSSFSGGVDSTVHSHSHGARWVPNRVRGSLGIPGSCGWRNRCCPPHGGTRGAACRGSSSWGRWRGDGTGAQRHIIGEELCACRSEPSMTPRRGRKIGSGSGGRSTGHHRIRRQAKGSLIKTHHNRVAGMQR